MKSNKRLLRKAQYRRFASTMGPPTEEEYFAAQKKPGKGWSFASDLLGTATAFFSGGWKQPYQDTTSQQTIVQKPNNTPLFIGVGIVLVLILAVVFTRKS